MTNPVKTAAMHERLKNLPDDQKLRFAINWRMPHTLFNLASSIWRDEDLQGIDWYEIHKSRDLGTWASHGGQVVCQAM